MEKNKEIELIDGKPRFLYKYHSLNVYLMEMMTNAQFYMSSKSELNDPLDSTFTIELEDYINIYFEKYPELKNDKEQIDRVKFLFKHYEESFSNKWMDSIDNMNSQLRITCFTEDENNSLMWSNYASNHRGVCLKFDLKEDENIRNTIFPVEYRNELIGIKKLSDIQKCLLTKLKGWEIEKEWRIIYNKKKFDFRHEALSEIVLGFNVQESTLKWFELFRENLYYMHAPVNRLKLKANKIVKVNSYDEIIEE